MRSLAAVLAALALVAASPFVTAAPAEAQTAPGAVTYSPPVDGAVIDPFRPPATPYGSGNRGVDYATATGAPVRAAAGGEVVFAGSIGATQHVVLLHADGLRTSYSFLRSIAVRRGDRVGAGDVVGTSGPALHFGVRAGDAYLDPLALFGGPPRVHLIPDEERRPLPEMHERAGLGRSLTDFLGSVVAVPPGAIDWLRTGFDKGLEATDGAARLAAGGFREAASYLRDEVIGSINDLVQEARTIVHLAQSVTGAPLALVHVGLEAWRQSQQPCTAEEDPIPKPTERRLALLVAGFGSATKRDGTAGDVAKVDTAALGYAGADVFQFSYRGGTTTQNPYAKRDSMGDIDDAGKRLAKLLLRLSKQHPGVPIDIIAHSQGGLVARDALTYHVEPNRPGSPKIGTLVTLGTPHKGADLATLAFMLGRTQGGSTGLDVISGAHALGISPIDPQSPAAQQLAETSDFIRELNDRGVPDGLRVVSIAATTDLVVATSRAHLEGADNVVVDLDGAVANDHANLPASPQALREIALAINGRPPTCVEFLKRWLWSLGGDAISRFEDSATALTYWGLLRTTGWNNPVPDFTDITTKHHRSDARYDQAAGFSDHAHGRRTRAGSGDGRMRRDASKAT